MLYRGLLKKCSQQVWRHTVGFDGDRPRRNIKKPNGIDLTSEVSNTYEFLNRRSTRYSWHQSEPVDKEFDDLDSEEISKECDRGLMLFGTETNGGEEVIPSEEESSHSVPQTNGDVNEDSKTTTDEEMVQKLLIE